MRRATRIGFLLAVGTGIFAVTGCAAPSREVATRAEAGPMNERDRMRAEEWVRATRGLDFEGAGGLVEVLRIHGGTPETARAELDQAEAAFAANRIMEAMEHYGLAARHDPGLAAAYLGLGTTLLRRGDLERAERSFRTAIDHEPANVGARYELAMTLWAAGRQHEAIDGMRDALAFEETFGPAHERLAVWSYYTGDYEAAWRHVDRSEELGLEIPPQLLALLRQRMPDPR
jgi:tetratricopeptide (TPR) repeat protein